MISILCKYGSSKFKVRILKSKTIFDLKQKIKEVTKVPPKNQKLFGLSIPLDSDEDLVSKYFQKKKLKKNKKSFSIRIVGSKEEDAFVDREDDNSVIDDFDVDPFTHKIKMDEGNSTKLSEIIQKTSISLINPPRKGKKLVVFDIDKTIWCCKEMKKHGIPISKLKRPYLNEMFESIYPFFDIAIWSATSWSWLEIKLTESGLLSSTNYNISFVLDKTNMFKVFNEKMKKRHSVKPLDLIWAKFPAFYSKKNTVHVDDLSRNFVFNPKNGIKISKYSKDLSDTDKDLLSLTEYLLFLKDVEDVTKFNNLNYKQQLKIFRKEKNSNK